MLHFDEGEFTVDFPIGGPELDDLELVDDVDVFVTLRDGTSWLGVFISLAKLASSMKVRAESGELRGGLYHWESGLVIMRQAGVSAILEAIRDMVAEGDVEEHLIKQLKDDDPDETS
ncbi:hypothetical protein [Streptosporangium sp. NPDC051022]|uniref:hypothetical protein n=1 Tax=Streptosporangium sp. NPDC051022 TaxID=3155752 RepID=UPI003430ABE2